MAKDSDSKSPDHGEQKKSRDVKADRDLILELNFVPTWARQDPGENPYAQGGDFAVDDRRGPRRDVAASGDLDLPDLAGAERPGTGELTVEGVLRA